MTKTIRCIAIDDEPLALDIIEKFCQRVGNVELLKFYIPEDGLAAIYDYKPDIVFLDIEMDGTDGLEIASQLPENTCFIFTTAYLRYTLEGFDLDAVDYLHKPFAFSRFQIAFSKALRRIGQKHLKTSHQCVVVKSGYNNVNLPIDDILYIEAMEGYSKIFRMSQESVSSRILLKNMLTLLPDEHFLRIHRSFIVSRSKIKSYNRQEIILCNDTRLPVGRQYASSIIDILSK